MSRIVLDTNVYVSAYGFGGKPAHVLASVISGEHTLVTSPALLAEVADKLYAVLGFDDEHVAAVIRQLARIAEVVRPAASIHEIADESDNRVLECAVAGAADIIVSGDHHLLDLGSYRGIRVVRVAELLEASSAD
ncbi:MAG TPA: putative toxin-antitoxin system toxin component, PIN family [Coriobacteriia bacterium]|nr:putative toxin-antitoxin system toxin component, PIN family [Coriobacteriia bacterium]